MHRESPEPCTYKLTMQRIVRKNLHLDKDKC